MMISLICVGNLYRFRCSVEKTNCFVVLALLIDPVCAFSFLLQPGMSRAKSRNATAITTSRVTMEIVFLILLPFRFEKSSGFNSQTFHHPSSVYAEPASSNEGCLWSNSDTKKTNRTSPLYRKVEFMSMVRIPISWIVSTGRF